MPPAPSLSQQVFEVPSDGGPGQYVTQGLTTFNGASYYAAQSRGVASFYVSGSVNLSALDGNPVFKFLIDNGATAFSQSFLGVQAAMKEEAVALLGRAAELQLTLLIVNIVVFIACIWYFKHLLSRVSVERVNLYSIFLRAPKNVVLKLATENVRVRADDSDDDSDEEDGDDDDDDDDWTQRVLLEQQAKKKQAELAAQQAEEEAAKLQQQQAAAGVFGGDDTAADSGNSHEHLSSGVPFPSRSGEDPHRGSTHNDDRRGGSAAAAGDEHRLSANGDQSLQLHPSFGGQAKPALPPAGSSAAPAKKGLLHPHIANKAAAAPHAGNGNAASRKASVPGGSGPIKAPAALPATKATKKANKRRLQERGAAAYHFLAPLVIWAIVTIAGFATSYSLLTATISYVHQIRAAATAWQLAARIKFYAQELIAVPAGSPEAAYDAAKANLWQVIQDFESIYDCA